MRSSNNYRSSSMGSQCEDGAFVHFDDIDEEYLVSREINIPDWSVLAMRKQQDSNEHQMQISDLQQAYSNKYGSVLDCLNNWVLQLAVNSVTAGDIELEVVLNDLRGMHLRMGGVGETKENSQECDPSTTRPKIRPYRPNPLKPQYNEDGDLVQPDDFGEDLDVSMEFTIPDWSELALDENRDKSKPHQMQICDLLRAYSDKYGCVLDCLNTWVLQLAVNSVKTGEIELGVVLNDLRAMHLRMSGQLIEESDEDC